jgi:ADP-ribose pyrophosphatase YjhB (NUDIX family)
LAISAGISSEIVGISMILQGQQRWLEWAREIQGLAQTGLQYAENDYQRVRNQRLIEIAAEIISEHTELQYSDVADIYKSQIGYATPRVDVRGAVFRDQKILLVQERIDGGWTLPGGWVDIGDKPSEAVEREVWEEAGFRVKARTVIGIYDANRVSPFELFHAFKIVFYCEIIDGQARPSEETLDVDFFSRDEVPPTLSGERTQPRQISDAFSLLKNPNTPTVFD